MPCLQNTSKSKTDKNLDKRISYKSGGKNPRGSRGCYRIRNDGNYTQKGMLWDSKTKNPKKTDC